MLMIQKDTTIPPEMIRKALDHILGCDEIRNSQILARFLEYVVTETLAGNEDEIKEYTIGVKALGRPSDFNPQLDAVVRIHAGRLRRTMYQYYQGQGREDPVIIHIPKGTYVPVFNIRGTDKEILSANGYGHKVNHEHATDNQALHSERDKPVLAVIPFHNLSEEDSKNFFVAGIGEQLCIDLSRFQNLSVISYYSTSNYSMRVDDLRELKTIARLDYVLTGSVRYNDETLRLNIELISAESSKIIWADTYIRHMSPSNIFDIQQDIVDQVLNSIADDNGIIIKLNKASASPFTRTKSFKVQNALFLYYDYISGYDHEKFHQTIIALEHAHTLEPGNAMVCAFLSDMYVNIYTRNINRDTYILEKVLELSQSAVKADESCQHAHKSLALAYFFSGHKEKSLESIERCIQLNPKASGITSVLATALICQGEFAKGFHYLTKSRHLNPILQPSAKFGFILYYFNKKEFAESEVWLQRLLPIQFPIITILNIALQGKLSNGKQKILNEKALELKGHEYDIITRTIFDQQLVKEIIQGLNLAGLTVK